jgi:hypothetical protein
VERRTFAKAYGIKVRCYWELSGNMSRTWELFALNLSPPPPKKERREAPSLIDANFSLVAWKFYS